jgi:hypothetical protein
MTKLEGRPLLRVVRWLVESVLGCWVLFLAVGAVAWTFRMVNPDTERTGLFPIEVKLILDKKEVKVPETVHLSSAVAKVTLKAPSRGLLLLEGVGKFIPAVCGLIILILLRRTLRGVASGSSFTLKNADRIRWIGLLAVASALFELVLGIIRMFTGGYHSEIGPQVLYVGIEVAEDFRPAHLFLGLVVLVIAEVIRAGAIMEEERKLTV